jgi:hypothetical protein
MQIAQEHNVTGVRAEDESPSRSLYLVLEITADGVLMHPGCKSTPFLVWLCVFCVSSLAPVREQRGREKISTVDSRLVSKYEAVKSALSPAKYSETSSTGVSTKRPNSLEDKSDKVH